MKTYFDCIPCFTRQALDAARFASEDTGIHESVLRKVTKAVSEMDMHRTPPEMGALIYRLVREETGNPDPYKEIKHQFNQIAQDLWPDVMKIYEASASPFETAVRLAIAGNIIDFGVGYSVDHDLLLSTLNETLQQSLYGNSDRFEKAVMEADTILYIGDNAGEVVFDKILLGHIIGMKGGADKITFAVRGKPIINDITMADADETGMTDLVRVIDNGRDYPGTVLSKCSDTFLEAYREADLVISKGQGNYETLSGEDKQIYFLLKVKCRVVAADLGCDIGVSVAGTKSDLQGNNG